MPKVNLTGHLIGNMAFETELNGHKIITDASPDIGGQDLGPRPKKMMLSALIGCTGIDVMSILNKMKIKVEDLTISVDTFDTEINPKVYEDIHISYIFKGENLPLDKLERAVKLSQEKYCGVSQMLGNDRNVSLTYEIKLED